MKNILRKSKIPALIFAIAYILAFVIVHRSSTLRKSAANMLYWYYSDNPIVENVEFYGFWPLRQIGYHIPGFEARHNLERTRPVFPGEGGFGLVENPRWPLGNSIIFAVFIPAKSVSRDEEELSTNAGLKIRQGMPELDDFVDLVGAFAEIILPQLLHST